MSKELTREIKEDIDGMSHLRMAQIWRYSSSGNIYITKGPIGDYFEKKFREKGFFTPEISKQLN